MPLSTSALPSCTPDVISAVLASLSARSFPLTPACPGQKIHRSRCSRRLCMAVCQSEQPIRKGDLRILGRMVVLGLLHKIQNLAAAKGRKCSGDVLDCLMKDIGVEAVLQRHRGRGCVTRHRGRGCVTKA